MNSLFLLLALVPCCSTLFFSLNRSKKSLFVPLAIGLVFLVLFVINLNFKIFEISADARIWGFQERFKGSYRELWNEWNAYSRVGLVEATYKDGKNMFFGFDSGYGKAHLLKFDEKDPFRLKDEFFVIKYGYALKKPKKVLILFAGVGRDMVYAYAYSDGESDITGVEINPNIIRKAVQLKEYSLDIFFQKPNVKMVVREGRDYINQCKDKFDVIMLSWSGATFAYQAGIASHTSQYLYTVEAFAEYLKHLNSDGLLIILQQNMMRNLTTARQAYEYLGIGELNNKVIIAKESSRMSKKPGTKFWRSPDNDYHIIFKKSDYTNDELDRMDVFLGKNKLSLVYSPKACLPQYVPVKEFLNVQDPKQYVRDFNTKMLANVSPAFDDNPFSMNTYPFSIFFPKAFQKDFLKRPWTNFYLLSNYFLLIIVLITILFSFLFIIIPLIIKGRSQIKKSNLLFIAYFAILGMGFMFVEISLIQRLTLFLGHPIYAISLVLACLLITCGTGSLLSKDLFDRKLLNFKRSASILFFLMFFYIWILPQVLYALISFKLILKVLLVFFIILPLGFFLGMFFPQGLRIVEENDKSFIPWVWGINGTTSVVGTSMAAFLSIFFGFAIVSMLGQLAYFVILLIVMSPSWQRLST